MTEPAAHRSASAARSWNGGGWLRMLSDKQLRIGTPLGDPVLATSLDLGGNVLVEVARRGWNDAEPDARAALLAEHRMRVDAALAEVMNPPALLKSAERAIVTMSAGLGLSGPLAFFLAGAPPPSLASLAALTGLWTPVRNACAARLLRFVLRHLARRGLGRLSRLSF